MNKEEIKHFKALLRQGILRHKSIILDDKFQKELLSIIKDYEQQQSENIELKKQLNASRRIAKHHLNRELDLEYCQKEFINYLEKEIVDCKAGSGQQFYYLNILKSYKEIIGVKE